MTMQGILVYLLKVSFASSAMTIVYLLFFRKENLFQLNRGFLMAATLLPWIFPSITITYTKQLETLPYMAQPVLPLTYIPVDVGYVEVTRSVDLLVLIPVVLYFAGLLFFMLRMMFSYVKIMHIIKGSRNEILCYEPVCITERSILPFSFLDKMIIPGNLMKHAQLDLIIRHERCHIRQRHGVDILAAELFKAFQWFNPFAWVLARSIKTNLEYIADEYVTNSGCDPDAYQHVLFNVARRDFSLQLVSNLSQTQLKKRFKMMQNANIHKRLKGKYLVVLPLIAILLLSFCRKEITYQSQNQSQNQKVITGRVSTEICDIPIPGAYVGVKGHVTGTGTDANGNFSLPVDHLEDTLEVFLTQLIASQKTLIPLNNQSHIDIKLEDVNQFLQNVDRILGPGAEPVVVINDKRLDEGAGGFDPRTIHMIQILEGDKAVQKLGSEDARKGLVIISAGNSLNYRFNYHIYLNGKRYDGPYESINPQHIRPYMIEVGRGSILEKFRRTIQDMKEPRIWDRLVIATDEPVDRELYRFITGQQRSSPSGEPISFVNGKRYEQGLGSLAIDSVYIALYFTGEEAYELSGIKDARDRGLALINFGNSYRNRNFISWTNE